MHSIVENSLYYIGIKTLHAIKTDRERTLINTLYGLYNCTFMYL